MSETPLQYGHSAAGRAQHRAQYRADAVSRIYHQIGLNVLPELPDVFLVIIERALARDMRGVWEFAGNPGYRFLPPQVEYLP